jgi:hypothetical protein
LTLTLKFFLSKQSRWELDLKDRDSLLDWHVEFWGAFGDVSSTHAERSLSIERKEKEIEKVTISTIARAGVPQPRTLIIERDYKNYTFFFTMISQKTEKHADELNIVSSLPGWRTTPSQTIFLAERELRKARGSHQPVSSGLRRGPIAPGFL